MIDPNFLISSLVADGVSYYTGTPCSLLQPLVNCVYSRSDINFIPALNEGDAVAIASGVWLAGKKSAVLFQNSGLGNAVNPLSSLAMPFFTPFLGIVSLRGDPLSMNPDEPQHILMGSITTKLLDLLEIPWAYCPTTGDDLKGILEMADKFITVERRPFFIIIREKTLTNQALSTIDSVQGNKVKTHDDKHYKPNKIENRGYVGWPTRFSSLEKITAELGDDSCYVISTGKGGRELFQLGDKPNQFYMVGSMGCASSLALGIRIGLGEGIKYNVCVLDGDGAILMRMGNLAQIGINRPKNFIHIVLDNSCHDSTGGQPTESDKVDFLGIAIACGFPQFFETRTLEELGEALGSYKNNPVCTFIRHHIAAGSVKNLGRPTIAPHLVAERFRANLLEIANGA